MLTVLLWVLAFGATGATGFYIGRKSNELTVKVLNAAVNQLEDEQKLLVEAVIKEE